MANLTIGDSGEIALPSDMRKRYGLTPNTRIRIIETHTGILIIPLNEAPMSAELAQELAEWQSLGIEAWDAFPYEDESD